MMYGNKLAVAIKSNGKVLREFKDIVYLPFSAEYSIFIKNLETVRASIKILIDGNDIGEGTTFVIPASSSIEIERFVKNGNFNKGNRFKFIERNASVENHRGIGGEDGLVVVEYQFEQRAPKTEYVYKEVVEIERRWPRRLGWNELHTPPPIWYGAGAISSSNLIQANSGTSNLRGATLNSSGGQGVESATSLIGSSGDHGEQVLLNSANTFSQTVYDSCPASSGNFSANDAGITAAGSVSEQKFQTAAWFPTQAEKYSLVLKLLGQTETGKQVVQAVTVKKKQKCSTCDHMNKANAKFCTECGTSLEIV
jgi:hypothetical protein